MQYSPKQQPGMKQPRQAAYSNQNFGQNSRRLLRNFTLLPAHSLILDTPRTALPPPETLLSSRIVVVFLSVGVDPSFPLDATATLASARSTYHYHRATAVAGSIPHSLFLISRFWFTLDRKVKISTKRGIRRSTSGSILLSAMPLSTETLLCASDTNTKIFHKLCSISGFPFVFDFSRESCRFFLSFSFFFSVRERANSGPHRSPTIPTAQRRAMPLRR